MKEIFFKIYKDFVCYTFLRSIFATGLVTLLVLGALILVKGVSEFNKDVLAALVEIGAFVSIITFPLSFFISVSFAFLRFFTKNYKGFYIELYECKEQGKKIERVGYKDTFFLFRKWLFYMVWVIIVLAVLQLGSLFFLGGSLIKSFELALIFMLFVFYGLGGVVLAYLFATCQAAKVVRTS